MYRFLMLAAGLLIASSTLCADQERMSPELLWKLGRIGQAAVSSDGKLVAYTVTRYVLEDDKGTTSIYLKNLDSGQTRQLLRDWQTVGDLQFAKTPFGERILFVGNRTNNEAEKSQVWSLNSTDGGILQVTDLEDGAANLNVSPTGKHLALTIDVKLDKEVTELYEDLPKADARIIDSLMFRHWNVWHDSKYSHLHVLPINDDGRAGEAMDLMKDMKVDCPVPPFGGAEQIAWSPDGRQIVYTAKIVEKWAESTDSDIYLVDLDHPAKSKNLTDGMDGYDNNPVFSPDGEFLAFHSMKRPSFESDRNRIMILDLSTGKMHDATRGLDRTAHGAMWLPDGKSLLFTSEDTGTTQIFEIPVEGGELKPWTSGRFDWDLVAVFPDEERVLTTFMNMERPKELAIVPGAGNEPETLSGVNDDIYKNLDLPTIKQRWVAATDGKKIHCWVIYPPDFDPAKQYPMLTYCQGGPQSQIGQWFSFRWNFHLMAARGYVVVAPNRRGLPGFGRAWNDQISGDWGGQAMQDLLSATDEMLSEPFIDRDRAAAVGASFGGYTVYWMMGHHEDRFQCMIAHCGVFNLESMYGSTEELFFLNWDLGGPFWKSRSIQRDYDRFSPHRFVGNWKTHLLVIHGERDFRVPVTQGIEAFTAAKVQGVPSRFLYFPHEGHWVMKPQNGVLWHRVFFDWLDRYCKPE